MVGGGRRSGSGDQQGGDVDGHRDQHQGREQADGSPQQGLSPLPVARPTHSVHHWFHQRGRAGRDGPVQPGDVDRDGHAHLDDRAGPSRPNLDPGVGTEEVDHGTPDGRVVVVHGRHPGTETSCLLSHEAGAHEPDQPERRHQQQRHQWQREGQFQRHDPGLGGRR